MSCDTMKELKEIVIDWIKNWKFAKKQVTWFVYYVCETVAIVGMEYSSVSSDKKFYRKEDVDKLLIEKDKEIKWLEYLLYITSKVR